MKKYIISVLLIVCLFLLGCSDDTLSDGGDTISSTQQKTGGDVFVVGDDVKNLTSIYGIINSQGIQNITNSIAGDITYLDCQPGQIVNKGTLIATITPDLTQNSSQNTLIQQNMLDQQIKNLDSMLLATQNSFGIQQDILSKQQDYNQTLANNIDLQSDISSDDLQNQVLTMEDQLDSLLQNRSIDISKTKKSIANLRSQSDIVVSQALRLLSQSKDYQSMSDSKYSQYLGELSQSIIDITPTDSGSSAGYTSLANTLISSKSALDNLLAGYDTIVNNYSNQVSTLRQNIDNIQNNKTDLSDIQFQNQRSSSQFSLDSIQDQINNIQNTQDIQLTQLQNSKLSLLSNQAMLENNLKPENIYSRVSGIIKSKSSNISNKINPNTSICQIIATDKSYNTLQIFSPFALSIGQKILVYDDDKLIGQTKIQYELPYRDPTTQNFIYEIPGIIGDFFDGQKLTIKFYKNTDNNTIWIPVGYVHPQLNGNFVNLSTQTGFVEKNITLGDINGGMIQVLSGLKKGDQIIIF